MSSTHLLKAPSAVALDMVDYAQQAVDRYVGITGTQKLRHAPTPFCPEGSLVPSDDDTKGELAPNACKDESIMARPPGETRHSKADCDLATQVQKWSRNNDKQLHRLICYINSSKTHRLAGTIHDDPRDLHLALYVDADCAGEKADAKSTSGGYLVLKGTNSKHPSPGAPWNQRWCRHIPLPGRLPCFVLLVRSSWSRRASAGHSRGQSGYYCSGKEGIFPEAQAY